jgi:hypothetical protein
MTQRRYTLDEIDRMRNALSVLRTPGGVYDPNRVEKQVERELRTAMLGGVDPKEIIAKTSKTQLEQIRENFE